MARRFTLPILFLIIAASGVAFAGTDDCPAFDDSGQMYVVDPGGSLDEVIQYGDPDDITGNKGPSDEGVGTGGCPWTTPDGETSELLLELWLSLLLTWNEVTP